MNYFYNMIGILLDYQLIIKIVKQLYIYKIYQRWSIRMAQFYLLIISCWLLIVTENMWLHLGDKVKKTQKNI